MPSPWPSLWVKLAIVGAVLLGIATVGIAHLTASSAYANGRVVEFDRRIAGAYEIALGKIPPTPIVGNFYLSILLTDAASKAPLLGANVMVSAVGPIAEGATGSQAGAPEIGPPEVGPIIVSPDPDPENYPGYYDTVRPIVLDRTGEWIFTVSVDSPEAGAAEAEFPVEVTTPNPVTGIVTLVALLAFIIVVALAIRMYIRERRRSSSS